MESVIEKLEFYVPKKDIEENLYEKKTMYNSKDVFIVHGRDGQIKLEVKNFITDLGLNPIILHEKANNGLTIIEKIEKHSPVTLAIVLLTPDDIGYLNEDPIQPKPRARQNVILELGYFMGLLGRRHVCVLYVEGVEKPSDYDGILYIPFDLHGSDWKMALCREMKAIGVQINIEGLIT